MATALRRIAGCSYIKDLSVTLSRLTLQENNRQSLCITQVRCMSRVKRRHTVPPFWLSKTTRTLYPENTTSANEDFVSEVVASEYSSPLKSDPWKREQWNEHTTRCGVIARKIGVYPMWKKDGTRVLSTLLQVSDNHVIKYITPEDLAQTIFTKKRDNHRGALVVGADSVDPREVTKEFFSLFEESGVLPKRRVTKFHITPNAKLSPGTPLYASHYRPGDYVDIAGVTVDRGFHGVMKRWGFKGLRASHGVTKAHRAGGNIGGGGEKARVWPGKKMPGHTGREKRILRGVKILRINTHFNVLWVQGPSVPGENGKYVYLYDSILPTRKPSADNPPHFPTFFQDEEDIEDEMFDKDLHVFSEDSITFAEK